MSDDPRHVDYPGYVKRSFGQARAAFIARGVMACEACGWTCPMPDCEPLAFIHLHHVLPRNLGGNHSDENLVAVCPNCHTMIHSLIPHNTDGGTRAAVIEKLSRAVGGAA